MALPVFPAGVKSLGLQTVGFCPTIASGTLAPTVAEITKTVSCDIVGPLGFGGEQSKGNPPARLCSKIQYERLGRFQPSMEDLKYVVNPQTPTDVNYQAYLTFKDQVSGFLVVRSGLDAQTVDWAAGQKVDVAPVTFGWQTKDMVDPDDEFGEFTVTQVVVITGAIKQDLAVLA